MSLKAKVFLSYSRRDETYAEDLRQRLQQEAPDITVLQDRLFLEGGLPWRQQIEKAINSVEFLVLVASPTACLSKEVRWEWQHAREQGACVYPVKVPGTDIPFDELPNWMRKAHFYDLSKEWPTFLQHLRSPCQVRPVAFMVRDLPEGYVERSSELQRLHALLLDDEKQNSVPGVVALRGEGGFGKTTLATAICRDGDVKTAFDDGILWVTLGETPSILAAITTLYRVLTGGEPRFTSQEDAEYHLSKELTDRNCLIVVDDVWNEVHLRPFIRGGEGCTRLVTTRLFNVALSAHSVEVGEIGASEATEILARGIDVADRGPFEAFGERLGHWPLLLGLARATLQERLQIGDTAEGALLFLNRALDEEGFEAFDQRNAEQRDQALAKTIDVSLRFLDEGERSGYLELGILPPETNVPLSTVEVLWGLGSYATEKRAQRLHVLSLLRLDLEDQSLWLRGAVHDYLARRLRGEAALHGRLVDAWEELRHPPDRYAWLFSGYHAASAGRIDVLRHRLGDPEWLESKLEWTDVQAVLQDFDYLPQHDDLSIVKQAVRLSAPHLSRSAAHLRSQLYDRLEGQTYPVAEGIRQRIVGRQDRPWLRAVCPVLLPAGAACLGALNSRLAATWKVAITANGEMALSAGVGGDQVQLWDLKRWEELGAVNELIAALSDESVSVTALSAVIDKKFLLGCSDGSLKLWDIEAEQETIVGRHSSGVSTADATLDGRLAISGSIDGCVKFWDLEEGKVRRSFQLIDHEEGVQQEDADVDDDEEELEDELVKAVAITGDGHRAVALLSNATVVVWELEAEICRLNVDFRASTVALTPDGCFVMISVSRGGSVITKYGLFPTDELDIVEVWNVGRRRLVKRHQGQPGWIHTIIVPQEVGLLFSASSEGSLALRRPQSRKPPRVVRDPSGQVLSVAITPDGRYGISASQDSSLRLWDLNVAQDESPHVSGLEPIRAVAIAEDQGYAVSCSKNATFAIWDLETGELKRILPLDHGQSARPLAIGRDAHMAVTFTEYGQLAVWNLRKARTVKTLESTLSGGYPATPTPDGRLALVAGAEETVSVFDFYLNKEIGKLAIQCKDVSTATVTDDGRYAVVGLNDGTVTMWDLSGYDEIWTVQGSGTSAFIEENGQRYWVSESGERRRLEGHFGAVSAVALAPDGCLTASTAGDRILLRSRSGDQQWIELRSRVNTIRALALSSDARWLAAVASNGYIGLVAVRNGAIIAEFGADTSLSACAISKDGRFIVAGGKSGVLHLLRLETV